ncbi:hypothetical protein CDCA_CDCA04G1327 [Cyanidium caldarium]|uniref:C3H1-type domain-containing protein n=1 Tax=Cyanidium caldarium TaxID=2771 RepID=A0AAV9ISI8_CYACA|nr:hypothetical protein CDCA_CDCA04G1327 [Cyanidium caldarium]
MTSDTKRREAGKTSASDESEPGHPTPRLEAFSVPVQVVDRRNYADALRHLSRALPHATFLAVDTEFSGFGSDARVHSCCPETRYRALRRLATTSAIFSVGVALFRARQPEVRECLAVLRERARSEERVSWPAGPPENVAFQVQVFEFLFLCEDGFRVDADTAEFLACHDMDFNRLFRYGVRYRRAHQSAESATDVEGAAEASLEREGAGGASPDGRADGANDPGEDDTHRSVNGNATVSAAPSSALHVLAGLIRTQRPVVFHNGLFDLTLMYAAFEATLPPTLYDFERTMATQLLGQCYDTRLLHDRLGNNNHNNSRRGPSFLQYLFRKHERHWFRHRGGVHVETADLSLLGSSDTDEECDGGEAPPPAMHKRKRARRLQATKICGRYARYGHCADESRCPHSHDLDRILDVHEVEWSTGTDATVPRSPSQSPSKEAASGRRKTTRRRENAPHSTTDANGPPLRTPPAEEGDADNPSDRTLRPAHSAGYDAFCTGYVFASMLARPGLDLRRAADAANLIFIPGGSMSHICIQPSEREPVDGLSGGSEHGRCGHEVQQRGATRTTSASSEASPGA